jgi:carbon-monoxide dehydrogenase medium subunit
MAGVFVAEGAAGLRVAVTGAASGVFRWAEAEQALTKKLSADALESLPLDETNMNEDIHATREYRANLARVMAKRALKKMLAEK